MITQQATHPNIKTKILTTLRLPKISQYFKSLGKKNAVFIWIPKAAGTSVYRALKQHGCPNISSLYTLKHVFCNLGIVTFNHMKYIDLVAEGYVSNEFDENSYKFCIARNPYDRAVSIFFQYKKINDFFPKSFTFLDFCRFLIKDPLVEIGLFRSFETSIMNPQVRWIEGIDMNFIGKLEEINADINTIMSALDVPNVSLQQLNRSTHNEYSSYYCAESQEIIANFYKDDFDFFNYSCKLA